MSVVRWIEKQSGGKQRYHIKHITKFKEKWVYDKPKRTYSRKPFVTEKVVEKAMIPPVRKTMYRLTLTINYVLRHKYYAVRLQKWGTSRDDLNRDFNKLREKIISNLENRLHYSRNDWWFPYTCGEAIQEVSYDSSLIGKEEIAYEYLHTKRR